MKKWLICDVNKKGNTLEYGIPVIAENNSNINRAYYLFGLQFGFAMELQEDQTAINQFGKKYMAILA